MWYVVENLEESDSCVLSADVRVPADSPWFGGHFPGEPILPGIAQLGMVFDAISRSGDRKMKLSSISRVRFKQAIRPDDHLRINIAPRGDEVDSYDFRILLGAEVVCSGVMAFRASGE